MYLDDRGIPSQDGQYIQMTRKDRLRRPEHVNLADETADPASGAKMSTEVIKVPLEFIHEYADIGTIAQMTSWIDLENWADEDLPMALKRRMHELTQNAFVVGRYTPGRYASDGSVSVPFDTTPESTVTLYGNSFTFQKAPTYYVNGRTNFSAIDAADRVTWADLSRIHTRLSNAGAPKLNGHYCAFISDAVKNDLMQQDQYFEAAIRNFAVGGKSLVNWQIATYRGFHFIVDDQPFTEDFAAENVRASWGPIHSVIITGKSSASYVNWGNKRTKMKPKFKVQDVSKTGKATTIGYTVPFQVAVTNRAWCAVLKTPVSESAVNG
jgi:N4-gp56 family major capsid protein